MKQLMAFLAVILILLLVSACGHQAKTPGKEIEQKAYQAPAQTSDDVQSVEPVQQVDEGLNDLDTLDQDLNFSDLDALDQELNFG